MAMPPRMPWTFIRSSRKPEASAPLGFPGPERMKDPLKAIGRLGHTFQPDNGLTLIQVGLGRLACSRHAIHVTIGCKLDPIGALHKRRFPVVTELGAMTCQGRWRVDVGLGRRLHCV